MVKQTDEYTAEEAAAALGVTHSRIRQLLNTGQLAARYEGEGKRKTWYIKQTAIDDLKKQRSENPPQPGWKLGRKRKDTQ